MKLKNIVTFFLFLLILMFQVKSLNFTQTFSNLSLNYVSQTSSLNYTPLNTFKSGNETLGIQLATGKFAFNKSLNNSNSFYFNSNNYAALFIYFPNCNNRNCYIGPNTRIVFDLTKDKGCFLRNYCKT